MMLRAVERGQEVISALRNDIKMPVFCAVPTDQFGNKKHELPPSSKSSDTCRREISKAFGETLADIG